MTAALNVVRGVFVDVATEEQLHCHPMPSCRHACLPSCKIMATTPAQCNALWERSVMRWSDARPQGPSRAKTTPDMPPQVLLIGQGLQ